MKSVELGTNLLLLAFLGIERRQKLGECKAGTYRIFVIFVRHRIF